MKKYIAIIFLFAGIVSCKTKKSDFDASGTFEAIETIISSEASGVLKSFTISEGQLVQTKQFLGYVDSVQLDLKRKQVLAQIEAILGKKPNISAQLAGQKVQISFLENELKRVENLFKAEAATQKQVEEMRTQLSMAKKQLNSMESSLNISENGLELETQPLHIQLAQLDDQLLKCRIHAPMTGTILTKYVEENEVVAIGKPLYKLADLSDLILRAYITGDQLGTIKLNQPVQIFVDGLKGEMKSYEGRIEWVSNKAEFTPKTIQTKDERANLVYAIKIRVKNDGYLKVGMFAEVKW